MATEPDPDYYAKADQFVKGMHRDVYPAVDPKNPKNSAAGKRVLVTGASRGIGKGIALAWAKAGAAVLIITGRDQEALQAAEAEVRATSPDTEVWATQCDIVDTNAVAQFFEVAKSRFGTLDVVVCNAGVLSAGDAFPKLGEGDPNTWWKDWDINVKGTYNTVHFWIKSFNGEQPKGTVVGLGTANSFMGGTFPGSSSYVLSKSAIVRLMEFVHAEYPDIRAFSFTPGMVLGPKSLAMLKPFARDTVDLAGALTVYLSTSQADHLRGRFVSSNWDVEEMAQHQKEIDEEGLLKTTFVKGEFGPEGHSFKNSVT